MGLSPIMAFQVSKQGDFGDKFSLTYNQRASTSFCNITHLSEFGSNHFMGSPKIHASLTVLQLPMWELSGARETHWSQSLSWSKFIVLQWLFHPSTRRDGNLKASIGMHVLVKREMFSSKVINIMGETTHMTAATSILLREQGESQRPIKEWPMEKCQVLAKEREVILPSSFTPRGEVKRFTEDLQDFSQHAEQFRQLTPATGDKSNLRPLTKCC